MDEGGGADGRTKICGSKLNLQALLDVVLEDVSGSGFDGIVILDAEDGFGDVKMIAIDWP